MQRRRPNPLDQPPSPLQQDVADLESPLHVDDDGNGEHLLIRDAAENLVASIALDRPQHESHDEI